MSETITIREALPVVNSYKLENRFEANAYLKVHQTFMKKDHLTPEEYLVDYKKSMINLEEALLLIDESTPEKTVEMFKETIASSERTLTKIEKCVQLLKGDK